MVPTQKLNSGTVMDVADIFQFDDKYYRDADGGEHAAVDLREAVRQHLQSIDGALAGLPIVVKAFASGDGLAYILSKAGIIKQGDAQDVVSRFTRGFSQADDMFEFVLVGKGKDRADHKLMGMPPPVLSHLSSRPLPLLFSSGPSL